jgi:predicted O-methyltransferase YrrM
MGVPQKDYVRCVRELAQHESFFEHVNQALESIGQPVGEIRAQGPELIYTIVRLYNPKIVVETGVAAGVSSAFILRALEDNHSGDLYSIDMPSYDIQLYEKGIVQTLPAKLRDDQIGLCIPPNLKQRWHLKIGISKDVLPHLLKQLGELDVFLHDSEHSYVNMMFEYKTSWAYLKPGGVLLSHDISLNSSFFDFSASQTRKPVRCYFSALGGIRK